MNLNWCAVADATNLRHSLRLVLGKSNVSAMRGDRQYGTWPGRAAAHVDLSTGAWPGAYRGQHHRHQGEW
jgi:hypothetical protein